MILQCMSAVSQCLKNLTTSQLKCKLRKTDWVGSLWCELEQLITIHTTSRPANLTATFISRHVFFLPFFFFFSKSCISQRTSQSISSREIPWAPQSCTGTHRAVSYLQDCTVEKGAKKPSSSADTLAAEISHLHDTTSSDRVYFLNKATKFFTKIGIQYIQLLQGNKHLPKKTFRIAQCVHLCSNTGHLPKLLGAGLLSKPGTN